MEGADPSKYFHGNNDNRFAAKMKLKYDVVMAKRAYIIKTIIDKAVLVATKMLVVNMG